MRTLLSRRRERFNRLVADAYKLELDALVELVRASDRLTPLARVAALRVVIGKAPIEVTQGAVYLRRRMLVRKHYGI